MRALRVIKHTWNKLIHAGVAHQCPVCGYSGRVFLPAGLTSKRINAKCPACGSLERHRQMVLIVESRQLFTKQSSLIHFAPEPCLTRYLRKQLGERYKTSHFNEKNRADFAFDIRKIDCADEQFDFVVCSHVLEHIDEDRKAMRELYRILKPGGVAFIQVPLWPSEKHPTYENPQIVDERDRAIHFGQHDHVRIYGIDVIDRMRSAGFEVEVVDLCQSLTRDMVDKFAIKNNSGVRDITFICRKNTR